MNARLSWLRKWLLVTGVACVVLGAPPAAGAFTLAQLAGQRVIFGFEGTSPPAALLARIHRGEAGGVILFTDNIASRAGLRAAMRRLQAVPRPRGLGAPLLVMIDQEGGLVKRLDGAPAHSPEELGRIGSTKLAFGEARATARNLLDVGVNTNLAPVLDVGRPGTTTRVYHRSFSGRASVAARIGTAFVRGLGAGGALATAKHFPGIGLARTNEDLESNSIRISLRRLRAVDEVPFRRAFRAGVPLVMTSTATYPALARIPALFSRRVVIDELRHVAGFRGVSITDDLDVPGLDSWGSPGARAVRAAQAGNDLLLTAQSYSSGVDAVNSLVRAVRRGHMSRAALAAPVSRILALRRRARP